MKVLDKGLFEFEYKEYGLLMGILRSAEVNIGTRDDKDADDRKQLKLIKRMIDSIAS